MSSQRHTTNPTRIQEIAKSNVGLRVDRNNAGEIDRLSLNKLDLSDLRLPASARVCLVGKARDTEKVFDAGTVASPKTIFNESLDGIDKQHPFHVRILVFDDGDKRILASCEKLSAYESEEGSLQSLLPVEPVDLGEQLWRVAASDGERPILQVSNDMDIGMLDLIKNDVRVQALVIPEAIRRSVEHLLRSLKDMDDDDSWQNRWIRYFDGLGIEMPDIQGDDEISATTADWVENTVSQVAHNLKLRSKTVSALPGDTE